MCQMSRTSGKSHVDRHQTNTEETIRILAVINISSMVQLFSTILGCLFAVGRNNSARRGQNKFRPERFTVVCLPAAATVNARGR